MTDDEILKTLALSKIKGLGNISLNKILKRVDSIEELFTLTARELFEKYKIEKHIIKLLSSFEINETDHKELDFIRKNNITAISLLDDKYPKRLRQIPDAPALLFMKGNCNLDSKRVISIVGTRNSTNYGMECCDYLVRELKNKVNDVLVVSGLAYGIDICAHRACLKYDIPTLGVLAHGLDRIYPYAHRETAAKMINEGGLITEYYSGTEPDRFNFVGRNRIVAGLCDTIIVVESNKKGGALITAELGNDYAREVFAIPGRITDRRSGGCNLLISENKAGIFNSVDAFIKDMNWSNENEQQKQQPLQQSLFDNTEPELNGDEKIIYEILKKNGAMHIDEISRATGVETFALFSVLLSMEMCAIIKTLPGSCYSLII